MFIVIGALQWFISLMGQCSFTLLFQLFLCTTHCLFSVIDKRFSAEGNVFLFFALLLSIYFLVEKSIEFWISRMYHDDTFNIFLHRLAHHAFKVLVHLPLVVDEPTFILNIVLWQTKHAGVVGILLHAQKNLLFLSAIELAIFFWHQWTFAYFLCIISFNLHLKCILSKLFYLVIMCFFCSFSNRLCRAIYMSNATIFNNKRFKENLEICKRERVVFLSQDNHRTLMYMNSQC